MKPSMKRTYPLRRAATLRLVDPLLQPDGSGERGQTARSQDPIEHAHEVISQAVMHAAMSWVRCCLELDAHTVEVSQIGPGLFDCEVQLLDSKSQWLRVGLDLQSGPTLRTTVTPLHP